MYCNIIISNGRCKNNCIRRRNSSSLNQNALEKIFIKYIDLF